MIISDFLNSNNQFNEILTKGGKFLNTYERYTSIRDSKGVTDYEVAKRTEIPASTFSDWKKGRSEPKLIKLVKIADYFGVSISELIGVK